ncbi:MAG TPA: hypothetical protein VF597_04265 [Candidatus Saccharimonadales bacterium]|jgi:hypothetical protein
MKTDVRTVHGVDIPSGIALTVKARCSMKSRRSNYDFTEAGGANRTLVMLSVYLGVEIYVYIDYPSCDLDKLTMSTDCWVSLCSNGNGGLTVQSLTLPNDSTQYLALDIVH